MKAEIIPKKDKGFTLVELMVAIGIFGMIIIALATIYSTSHRHLIQNFRENVVKNSLSMAFKAIQQELSTATRIDNPPYTGSGNTLAYAKNISSDGCYPIDGIPDSAQWGYVCPVGPDLNNLYKLYLHKDTAKGVGTGGCPAAGGVPWTKTSYPVVFCGPGGGGTVTLLMDYVDISGGNCFMRDASSGITEIEQVRIRLTVKRPATSTGREITATLDTVAKINMSTP